MPYQLDLDYSPPFWLKNGHLGTVYPFFRRKLPTVKYDREILNTTDDDHFAVDKIFKGNDKIAFLLHGLEGSSSSQYIIGMSHLLSEQGWDIAAINYRGCGGLANKTIGSYHSGATDDIHQLVNQYLPAYDTATIIGFSLGGNMTMKYLGDRKYTISPKIKNAIAISTPVDLSAGSDYLNRWVNRGYSYRFLKSLLPKVASKMKQFPGSLDPNQFQKIKTIRDFDDFYTGPVHGFRDAEDYYQQCSCAQFLEHIKIPSYMINALDDPFIPTESYPFDAAAKSKQFQFITPKYGGHVGFYIPGKEYCWQELKVLEILE